MHLVKQRAGLQEPDSGLVKEKDLISTNYVPGAVLGAMDAALNKTRLFPSWINRYITGQILGRKTTG